MGTPSLWSLKFENNKTVSKDLWGKQFRNGRSCSNCLLSCGHWISPLKSINIFLFLLNHCLVYNWRWRIFFCIIHMWIFVITIIRILFLDIYVSRKSTFISKTNIIECQLRWPSLSPWKISIFKGKERVRKWMTYVNVLNASRDVVWHTLHFSLSSFIKFQVIKFLTW